MRKEMVFSLKQKALQVATNFSNPDRLKNGNKETFSVGGYKPLSETTAAVYFLKNTGKVALAFFYFVNIEQGQWYYFFPTDSHILGMESFGKLKQEVESGNFDLN